MSVLPAMPMPVCRTPARLLVPAAAVLLALLGPTPARAAGFSTEPVVVAAAGATPTAVSTVRVGHHADFDRIVFTFTGPVPGYSVAYVSRVVADGSGAALPLPGSAFVRITVRPTSTTVHAPQDTRSPHFPMLRQVAGAGDFEAVTSYGVGLATRSGMRVFTLTGPNRLVVDFAIPPTGSSEDTEPIGPDGGHTGVGDRGTGTGGITVADPQPEPTSTTPARATDDRPPGAFHSGVPALPVILTGVALAGLGVGGYHLLRRRPG